MDIVHRSRAPSLHNSSMKTLFDMDNCSTKMDWFLIAIVSLSIVFILYRNTIKVDDDYTKR